MNELKTPIVVTLMRSRPFENADGIDLFRVLNESIFVPSRFDNHEPIRQEWSDSARFQELWESELGQWFGMVLMKCAKPTLASISAWMPYGPNARAHYLTVSVNESKRLRADFYSELIETIDDMFQVLKFDYGNICYRSEYFQKNITQTLLEGGKILREQAIGTEWPRYFPGLYWINYFGDTYREAGMDWACVPSTLITNLTNGVRLQMSAAPGDWQADFGGKGVKTVEQLGTSWFFSQHESRSYRGLDSAQRNKFQEPPPKKFIELEPR